jgi:hypothetical protein
MSCIAVAACAAALCIANAALADDDDYPSWRPNSTSATSITGPIIVLPTRLHAANADFRLHLDSTVAQFAPDQGSIPSRIYAVTSPANPVLLNGNTLCGDAPPKWIVVVPLPPTGLEIDAFTSADKPSSQASPGLCKTFSYIR